MSFETFDLLDRLRRSGKRAVMATLVRTKGSTPRKEGSKMFVDSDGNIFGSVTIGGCVDGRVIEASHEVLMSSTPRLLSMKLGDDEAWEIGFTCAGEIDVLVEPVTADLLQMYDDARREIEAGRTATIARAHTGYVETLRPRTTLVIFGASAIAMPLVPFAKQVGLRTIVVDSRTKFATRERFPDADEIRTGIVSEIAEQLKLGPATPVVLTAHDHKIEVPVLKRVLASDVPYIGLLGSRRRGGAILDILRNDGIAESQLSRIKNPIGLDLGGDSAADIALSIVSEIVATMNGRSGRSLSAA